jgi:L-alanine-DL-glutamate epimerase-like enolase superfamily enzyme
MKEKSKKTVSTSPENDVKNEQHGRRDFIQKATFGGLGMGMFFNSNQTEKELEFMTQKVSRYSAPTDLKITDLRIAYWRNTPIIKIYTNQDIYGLGEVRDGGSPTYALFLKSRLLGKNPCNVERIFKNIKQFGGHGRAGGGVSGVEIALWDLVGKAYGVPVYQLLGGKYRDKVRMYADTPSSDDPAVTAQRIKSRIEKGYTFVKIDFGLGLLVNVPGAIVGNNMWDLNKGWTNEEMSYGQTKHPFTGLQITELGIQKLTEYIERVREITGYEIPIATDHYGHFDHNTGIRLGKAADKYRLAWMEDIIPWFYTEQWKEISHAIETPTLTGEDIFLKEEFKKLCDNHAVDMIQPDMVTAGGILETKKIGDYAEEQGVSMALHWAGSPVSLMANVHCAAATQNFIALEHHHVDVPDFEDLATGVAKPIIDNGFIKVPETPGLGVDLNEEAIKKQMKEGEQYFAPTPQWDKEQSWDRTWS